MKVPNRLDKSGVIQSVAVAGLNKSNELVYFAVDNDGVLITKNTLRKTVFSITLFHINISLSYE